jgi:putative ABC transport system substrate-binding protein
MTQSGHRQGLPVSLFEPLQCFVLIWGMGMKRREFITLLGGVAAAWPVGVRAQHQNEPLRRVGVLMAYLENDAEAQKYVSVFQDALREFGWAEGRNLSMTLHWAGPELAAIEQAAKELVKWRPDVILSSSTPTTAALLRVTRTIPVVFAIVSDHRKWICQHLC